MTEPAASQPAATAPDEPAKAGVPLHWRMVIGIVVGLVAGLAANGATAGDAAAEASLKAWIDGLAQPIGKIFLNLIFMVVVPLVTSSVMLGVIEMGDLKALGRVGLRTLGWTVVTSSAAVFLGVALVSTIKPGAGVSAETRARLLEDFGSSDAAKKAIANAEAAKDKPALEALVGLIPTNPVAAAANALTGDMLALMLFSLMFGAALSFVRDPLTEPIVGVLTAIQRASLTIVGWAMALAPVGVAAILFSVTARTGVALLATLGAYVLCVLGGLLIQLLVVYGVILRFGARVDPVEWFRRCREVILTSFSTSSSSATLPTSLATATGQLGIQSRVSSFVLTVGATGNQNGTALFEGITVLFLAQVFGVELSLESQVKVVLMSILAGVGTAGVPGGSLPLIVILLVQLGIPAGAIAIILGVDRLLDMSRTVVNVVGDLVIATAVARAEGAIDFDGAGPISPAEPGRAG